MEIGLAVGGAFLFSALNVLFDRLTPQGDLLKMFQNHKNDVRLLKKLRMTLPGIQGVLSDAENKQASNRFVSEWLNELRDAALRLKVEAQHQNLAETSKQQVSDLSLCLSDDFLLNIKEKLEETIETLEVLEKQIGRLGLKETFGSTKQETRKPSTSLVEKEQVIHLWISNGLVPHEDEIIQDTGNKYFLELRSRSLFERVPNPSQMNSEKFLMHDLVNDLARHVSSNLCIRLEESEGSHVLEKIRHLSYSVGDGEFEKLTPLYKLEQLRTLLPINIQGRYSVSLSKRVLHNILPRLRSLRALSLSHYRIKELPDALFIKLKLLRFLDLSHTQIKKLPDTICALYNLETLPLSCCYDLKELPLLIEKLINLHHLDISNASRLKIPFLLGDSRMEDLGKLHNLYGSLSILELQNVLDRKEALKAKTREKNHVEMLSLEWSESIADNSQTERDILDELQPHTNIKELKITGYRGTQFPNWLADPSYLKLLVQLSLSNCKDCYSLPALGQLPSLKFVSIKGMHGITEVAEEFYGSSSSQKPFNSLEELEFGEIPEWKQWHILGNGEFPTLQNLSIKNCPKLMGRLHENLCSLKELRIWDCPEINFETPIQLSSIIKLVVDGSPKVGVLFDEVELFTSQLQGMKQIDELCLADCNSLTSLPFSILPTTLKRIEIYGCRKLKLEAPVGEIFLEDLRLKGCDSIDDISCELVPRARTLSVKSCHNFTRFLIPTGTERIDIIFCEKVEILSVACGTQMTSLNIKVCKKLKRLPERMQELLPSLNRLELLLCPEIESFPEGGLPFHLQNLSIFLCEKLVNNRKEWRLERLPCLRGLSIYHNGSDEEIVAGENWELPCSIRRLTVSNLKTLSSQVLKSLTSLEYLYIRNLPQIQSLVEEGLPSSLSELCVSDLHSLPSKGLRHLTSLRTLGIYSCPNLHSLAELELPSSLSQLTIWNCPNLHSLAELELPSSLSQLIIWDCPNLQSLPLKGMPSSLSSLEINECPLLEPLLEFDKGEYWPKIAHISTIRINLGEECL
ncbi:unnamed protein product [Withania somnifera]